jgi:hypothetical protein
MDNLSFGLDACYYQPGKYYKNFIETDLGRYATTGTGKEMKNTYAARWIAKVTF